MTTNRKMKAKKTKPFQTHFRQTRRPKVSSRTQSGTQFVQTKLTLSRVDLSLPKGEGSSRIPLRVRDLLKMAAEGTPMISCFTKQTQTGNSHHEKRNEPKIGWHLQATLEGGFYETNPNWTHYANNSKTVGKSNQTLYLKSCILNDLWMLWRKEENRRRWDSNPR
jgi:hypothetical protein